MADTPNVFTDIVFTLDDGDGADDFSCPVTSATFTPSSKINQARTACGVRHSVGASAWTLEVQGLQDYFKNMSLAAFLRSNEGQKATAKIVWTSSEDPDVSAEDEATVTLVAVPFGGQIDENATFQVSLPVDGIPALTYNQIAS